MARAKRKDLTTETKGFVVGMLKAGKSITETARHFGLPRTTVGSIKDCFDERGTVVSAPKSGRPRIHNDRDIRELSGIVGDSRRNTLSSITDQLTKSSSSRTVRRRVHELGIFNRCAVKKPFVNEKQRAARLAFATDHLSWTEVEWARILWSDESSFEVGKLSKRTMVWRDSQSKHHSSCLQPTFKSGRTSIMVWGAFFGTKKCPLVFLPPNQRKSADFIKNVYEAQLQPFLSEIDPDHQLTLMEDNAPVHTSLLTREYRKKNGINKIEKWPAQSPDLNPIENVWKVLKTHVQELYHPKDIKEMQTCLTLSWDAFPAQTLKNLIVSMPNRMKLVVEANGGPIRY